MAESKVDYSQLIGFLFLMAAFVSFLFISPPSEEEIDIQSEENVVIDDSFNVSSVTDNEEGKYTQNWTNSMGSANYAIVGMRRGYHLIQDTDSNSKLSTSIKIRSWYVSSTAGGRTNQDSSSNMTILNGDLA